MKLFDIGQTVENAVRGLAQFNIDFLTVHGDPHVVRAAMEGAAGTDTKILAVTILTSLDRADLDDCMMQPGAVADMVEERAGRALEAGADGVIASPQEAARIRGLNVAQDRLIVTPACAPQVRRLEIRSASRRLPMRLKRVRITSSSDAPSGRPAIRAVPPARSWPKLP